MESKVGSNIFKLIRLINSDYSRYKLGSPFNIISCAGFQYILLIRFYQNLPIWLFFLKPIIFILHRVLTILYGYQIGLNTRIGCGIYIGHPSSIIINGNAIIGNNCNISHNVTIGKASRGKKRGCPKIGNFVWIGPGSVIVGDIRIGNNVFIAANSVVNQDIQDNARVYSGSSDIKIINSSNAVEGLINNI